MTHERTRGHEPPGGPQHDLSLPDADDIPVSDGPDDLEPVEWPGEWDG